MLYGDNMRDRKREKRFSIGIYRQNISCQIYTALILSLALKKREQIRRMTGFEDVYSRGLTNTELLHPRRVGKM